MSQRDGGIARLHGKGVDTGMYEKLEPIIQSYKVSIGEGGKYVVQQGSQCGWLSMVHLLFILPLTHIQSLFLYRHRTVSFHM